MLSRYITAPLLLCAACALTACSGPTGEANNATPSNNSTAANNSAAANNSTATNNTTSNASQNGEMNNNMGGNADANSSQNNATPDVDMGSTPTNNMVDGPDMAPEPDMKPVDDVCQDTTVYVDGDGDGQAADGADSMQVCLKAGEAPDVGYAREVGDCDDRDPLQFTGADGVCGDNVDDDCDSADEACPTSMPAQLDIPDWDCTGDAPENVVAYSVLPEQQYFSAGSCFYFFEGGEDVFYVKLHGFERQQACTSGNGCCAEFGGYDNRLYAFTTSDADPCEDIVISQSGSGQPVSNSCRKYLYQMNMNGGGDYSFVANSIDTLTDRIEAFGDVEIACVRDTTLSSSAFPFGTLATSPIVMNEGYKSR